MLDGGQQPHRLGRNLDVQGRPLFLPHGDLVAGAERRAGGSPPVDGLGRLLLLHAPPDHAVGFLSELAWRESVPEGLGVASRIVVNAQPAAGRGTAEPGRDCLHGGVGLLGVIVAQHPKVAEQLHAGFPAGDGFVVQLLVVHLPGQARRSLRGAGLVAAEAVGQHHPVAVRFVPEVVADAFLFQQPADEVEVRLPVLHAVLPLSVQRSGGVVRLAVEPAPQRKPETVLFADVHHDVGHRLEEEGPAVGAERQQRQPGDKLGPVADKALAPRDGGEPPDVAAEMPVALIPVNRDGHGLAQELLRAHLGVHAPDGVGEQIHLDAEGLRYGLHGDETVDEQHVGIERRFDRKEAALLGEGLKRRRHLCTPHQAARWLRTAGSDNRRKFSHKRKPLGARTTSLLNS